MFICDLIDEKIHFLLNILVINLINFSHGEVSTNTGISTTVITNWGPPRSLISALKGHKLLHHCKYDLQRKYR